jgi:transcriptional regulator GlxA family with amidase domain
MQHYGAVLADARVVVDGNLISAAGVTAGLDGALAGRFYRRDLGGTRLFAAERLR